MKKKKVNFMKKTKSHFSIKHFEPASSPSKKSPTSSSSSDSSSPTSQSLTSESSFDIYSNKKKHHKPDPPKNKEILAKIQQKRSARQFEHQSGIKSQDFEEAQYNTAVTPNFESKATHLSSVKNY